MPCDNIPNCLRTAVTMLVILVMPPLLLLLIWIGLPG